MNALQAMKIKISALDKKFSQYIRSRDGWTCQRCWKKYTPPTAGLHCSHFWGRANKSVRFDSDNCIALCFGCHQLFTANPSEHFQWYYKKLGEKKFISLEIRKHKADRPDYKMVNIWLTEKLKKINSN